MKNDANLRTKLIGIVIGTNIFMAVAAIWASGATLAAVGMPLVATLALLAGVAWWFGGFAVRPIAARIAALSDGSHQVTSAAQQVASGAQTLSQGSTEQAASLEETSASMEEMAAMTRQNAEHSQQAASLMTDVDQQVTESTTALNEMVASMEGILESSNKVAKIIKTIDEIAFQTNILALNAAVEAARAGEAGMGFAVVADEVRNLAQRSAQAAKDTAALIEESAASTARGNNQVRQVASAIAGITESVTKAKGLFDDVSLASRQQAQGIEQVTQAVSQMEKVTQMSAATAEENAAASEQLSAQAEVALRTIDELAGLVGGTDASAARVLAHVPKSAVPSAVVAGTSAGSPRRADVKALTPKTAAPAASAAAPTKAASAADLIPFEETGTYGSF